MSTALLWAYRGLTSGMPGLLCAVARRAHTRQGGDPARLDERFGRATQPRPDGPLIWGHAASVGEVQTLAPLAPALAAQAQLLVTTATHTGAARVASALPPETLHQFQPIDTPRAVARFLDHWRPDLAVFSEADMPPNTLRALTARGVPCALVGARPSKTRRRAPKTARALLRHFDALTAASPSVATDLRALGLKVDAIEDLKALRPPNAPPPDWPEAQRNRPLWLAASTHPEDLPLIFAAQKRLLETRPDTLLMLAPRHPSEDRDWMPPSFGARFASDKTPPDNDTQVFVMDQMGQLPGLHALTKVTYLGGGNGTRGGHSPWEAAAAGNVILTGPDIANNAPAFAGLAHQIVTDPEALARAVQNAWHAPRTIPHHPVTTGDTAHAVLALLETRSA
ncbi:MAG: hypothetical protein OQK05_03050 [Pseudopelagicola sp.]|nr:hypothetical protein [Pseudopelagicola sp.]